MKLYCNGNNTGKCFLSYEEAKKHGEPVYSFDANPEDIAVSDDALSSLSDDCRKGTEVSLTEYKFGSFLKPVVYTNPESVYEFTLAEKSDSVKIFESNEKFYIECLFQELKEKYPNFELYAVRSCFETLVKMGKMEKTETDDFIFYKDIETGKITPVCKKI